MPNAFCRDCKQKYIHVLNHLLGWELRANRGDRFREDMVLEGFGIVVVLIEVTYKLLRA